MCCHLISKYYSWLVPAGASLSLKPASVSTPSYDTQVDSDHEDTTKKYREWTKQNYLSCIESLQQLMRHSDHTVRWLALASLMKLIRAEGHAHQKLGHTYFFPNTFFHVIVSVLLCCEDDMCELIERFQEYLAYDDVRFYWLKNIA